MRPLIVTHKSPDLDAIGSVWLLRRFRPELTDAYVTFVPAGSTLPEDAIADIEKAIEQKIDRHAIIHTDTGLGEFDHHQPERAGERYSATRLVHLDLIAHNPDLRRDEALEKLVNFIHLADHFKEITWPEYKEWRSLFYLTDIIDGAKYSGGYDDYELLLWASTLLDAMYSRLQHELKADRELQRNAKWLTVGKYQVCAVSSANHQTERRALRLGADLMLRQDPMVGNVRIKARPDCDIDLTALYEAILLEDKVGEWFLHNSKKMLLNGGQKGPQFKPTSLSLTKILRLWERTVLVV